MRIQLLALSAMALLLIAPILSASPSGGGGGLGGPSSDGAPSVMLFLKAGTFDPAKDPAPGPSSLHSRSTHPFYVLQFDGPIQRAWREVAADAGAELLGYLPDYGYFARIGADSVDRVRALDHVRYLGPAHPAYRVSPALWDAPDGVLDIEMRTFDSRGSSRLAAAVLDAGGAVLYAELDGVTARISARAAIALAERPELAVEWVEQRFWPEPLLDNDARTAKARQALDGGFQNNGASMWSYDPTTDSFKGWTGRNVTVAVDDSGLDDSHPAFAGRIVQYYDYGGSGQSDTNGHGTHVAGIVLGDGSWRSTDTLGQDGKYAGLAPASGLVVQEIFSTFYGVPTIARDASRSGATINVNSWGGGYWGEYYSLCADYDDATRDADNWKAGEQPMLFTFSAGNDGWYGANTITPPATAKNIITVGATGNDKYGASSSRVAGFSSRGPTDDGRLKPDLVIAGDYVSAARSMDPGACSGWSSPPDGARSYVFGSGTSMASPGVGGAAAVLTQYLVDVEGITPSPALLKANLINGARILPDYGYPGNAQGWGAVDLVASTVQTDTYRIIREDQRVDLDTAGGQSEEVYYFMVYDDAPLKVTLVWTDPGGVGSSTKDLINDLDLTLVAPDGTTYKGNVFFNGQSQVVTGTTTSDRTNNVEGFYLTAPMKGVWTVKVSAFNIPEGPQDFALVASGHVVKGYVDLAVSSLTVDPAGAEEHTGVRLSARLANLGNQDSDEFTLRFEQMHPDGRVVTVGERNVTGLGASSTTDVMWTFTGARGTHYLKLTLDTVKVVPESNESNNVVVREYFFAGYDATVAAQTPLLRVDPGAQVEFNVTVGNGGNVEDDFSLALTEGPPGWRAEFVGAESFALAVGGTTAVHITVTAPSNATVDERASLVLTVTPLGNASRLKTVTLTAVVNQVFDMGMSALVDHLDLLPGAEGAFRLVLLNPGNGPDTYELQLPTGLGSGWWVTFPQPTINVAFRSQGNLDVVLSAPDPAPAGSQMYFDMVARSTRSGMERTVRLTATVLQFYDSTVEAVHREWDAEVGATVRVPLRVGNHGNGPVEYTFDVMAPSSEWATVVEPGRLEVPGYSEGSAQLTFKVPAGALNRSFPLSVAVVPSGGDVLYHNFSFSARQFHDLSVASMTRTPTVTQGMGTTLTFRVSNLGNGVEVVRVLVAKMPDLWSATVATEDLTVEAFGSVDVPVTFETSRDTPRGGYQVGVVARYAFESLANATANVNIITRPDLVTQDAWLTVSDMYPVVGSLVQVNFTVENRGDTPASDVRIQVYIDGAPFGAPHHISSLEPGEVEHILVPWLTNMSGMHVITVAVDPDRTVDEMDEANNGASITLSVDEVDYKTTPSVPVWLVAVALAAATLAAMVARSRRTRADGR